MANEPILVDPAFANEGYVADHTRIYSIGALSEELLSAPQSMLDIQAILKEEINFSLIAVEKKTRSCQYLGEFPLDVLISLHYYQNVRKLQGEYTT